MRTARVIPWHVKTWGKEWLWKKKINVTKKKRDKQLHKSKCNNKIKLISTKHIPYLGLTK